MLKRTQHRRKGNEQDREGGQNPNLKKDASAMEDEKLMGLLCDEL